MRNEIVQWRDQAQLFLSRATWSFINQAIVSAGTFLTVILLARHLPLPEYGIYSLLLTVNFSALLFSFWLSSYPLAVRLARAGDEECARLSTSSLLLVAALCLPLSVAVGLTLFAFGRPDLTPPGLIWFILWQLQQATRRSLLANLRHREAVIGDAVSNLGAPLFVGLLTIWGPLSLSDALYCIAATAMLGAIVQVLQLKLVMKGLYPPHRWLLDNASLGAWSLASGVVCWVKVTAIFWLIAVLSGTASVALLQAAFNVFSVLNPIFLSLANLIPQITARAFESGGKQSAWSAARPYILVALPPTLLYVLVALLFSPFLLRLFYGHNSPYLEVGNLIPSLAIFTACWIPTELVICYFLGLQETKLALKFNLVGIAAVAISLTPFIVAFGLLEGSCVALAVGELVRLAVVLGYIATYVQLPFRTAQFFKALN